jgi:histidinol-phosphatase (PHP family)
VKLGIEVDYLPGREDRIAALIEGRPWDYVIGSVHFVEEGAVDHDGYDAWAGGGAEQVWRHYFETVGGAARSGLFDVLAHLDLVKVWGRGRPAPSGDLRAFYELALEGIAESDVAIEVSTAGLRKPVAEIYPSRELLDMCREAGRPVALSSDAHEPEFIGHEYDAAMDFMREAGITELSVFERRRRTQEPLG